MRETIRNLLKKSMSYLPIISVMLFWLGACLISSLMVDTPHITHLGFVTLPLVAASIVAAIRISRRR